MNSSLRELYLARLREFYRQPARIFWVYGFPLVMAVGLGLAFRNPGTATVQVDLVRLVPPHSAGGGVARLIAGDARGEKVGDSEFLRVPAREGGAGLDLRLVGEEEGERRIKTGKSALLVVPDLGSDRVTYRFDPTRPEASAARAAFDDALQRANGRTNPVATADDHVTERGSRYIDFLIPGLIGLNTMGGGLWGVGFLLVNFRIGKLLKRFMATPMPRRDFLLAILGARLTFLLPDAGVLLALGYFGFGMPIRGNLGTFALLEVVGALAFCGIGLLVASRARTTETVSGLMNLVMLPMWMLSGVFFSSERFPAVVQPVIQALPLTQLIAALRAVLLEGAGLGDRVVETALLVLTVWAVGTFWIALRIFRWT